MVKSTRSINSYLVNWLRSDLAPGVDHIFRCHRPATAVFLIQFTGEATVDCEGAEVVPANLSSLIEYLFLRLRALKNIDKTKDKISLVANLLLDPKCTSEMFLNVS